MANQTVVTLVDDEGYEFPVALPGVFRANRAGDIEAAQKIAAGYVASGAWSPDGLLRLRRVEYMESAA